MNMCDLIVKKKRGYALSEEEIQWMIREYTDGKIPDYQMSAMMMAICFAGMTPEETKELTRAMAHSGDMLDLSGIQGIKVDKHSTGGVGDKTVCIFRDPAVIFDTHLKITEHGDHGRSHHHIFRHTCSRCECFPDLFSLHRKMPHIRLL